MTLASLENRLRAAGYVTHVAPAHQTGEVPYDQLYVRLAAFSRHVHLVGSAADERGRMVLEAAQLVEYPLDQHGPTIEAIASGQKTLAQVVAEAQGTSEN